MVKHTQTIGRQKLTNYLSVFGHSVGLLLEQLIQQCDIEQEREIIQN